MDYKAYRVVQGQYCGVYDTVISIPDKLKLMSDPEECGHCVHTGHQHYIGIIKGNEESIVKNIKGLHVYTYTVGEYVIITIHDIKFTEPYPYLISEDEFNEEFKVISSYIRYYSIYIHIKC